MPPPAKLPRKPDDLDGVTKAAVLLLSLEPQAARAVLASLPVEMVEDVTRTIAQIGDIPASLSAAVVEEFYGMKLASQYAREGGMEYAASLLRNALPAETAERVLQQVQTHVQKAPFGFLQKAASESILTFIQDEHPQTIALVMSHLPHTRASEVLVALPQEKQVEVVRRMAHMEQTNPDVIREVEAGLASRFSSMVMPSMERVGGVEAVAEVLNLCDRTSEKSILEGIETEDPELVEQIRRLMFVFEDLLLVDDKGIQSVLKEVDNDELCLSLKTASDELKEKIFTNMSTRAAELIKEEMQYLGPVRLSDVEAAQQRIVDIVRRLEDAGELIVSGRGGEGDVVV